MDSIGQRSSGLRVALVQDFLVHMRGAERVLRSLSDIFPHADVYALVADHRLIEGVPEQLAVTSPFV